MFGFAPFSDAPFGATQHTSLGLSTNLASVSASFATNVPTITGIANTSLPAVSGTFATRAIDFGGFSRITIDSVLTASNINSVTTTAIANITPTAVVSPSAVNLPTINGVANTTLATLNQIASALNSVDFDAQATASPASLSATISTTLPNVSGKANVTSSSLLANILQNLDDPVGESFDFNSIANSYSRGRTVIILAPTVRGTYTVYIPFENRTVVLSPSTSAVSNAARFVYIKPEDRKVFIEPVNIDRVVYITN